MKPSWAIEEEAGRWLVRRDRADLTAEECARFESWLAADSRHRAAYLDLEATWRHSNELEAWRSPDGGTDPSILRSAAAPHRTFVARRWTSAWAVAATLVAALGVGWFFLGTTRPETYTTEVGGYQRILLRDGSVVQLNTDTEVRVAFEQDRRDVRLVRGEAFFEVAHQPARPFRVIAGGTIVHAVGTAFTVRLGEEEDVEVVVTEGRVAVRTDVSLDRRDGDTALRASAVSAGESAIARAGGIAVSRIPAQEIVRRLAWQVGELSFRGEPLIRAVTEFNRYNRTRIEIVDPQLAALEVGGNFDATDPESFVRALESALPIRAEESGDIIQLTVRK